jgi:hypothetical protein
MLLVHSNRIDSSSINPFLADEVCDSYPIDVVGSDEELLFNVLYRDVFDRFRVVSQDGCDEGKW